jgi:hypothetical protein
MNDVEYNVLQKKSPHYIKQLLLGNIKLLEYKNLKIIELTNEIEMLKDLNNMLQDTIFKIEHQNITLKLNQIHLMK